MSCSDSQQTTYKLKLWLNFFTLHCTAKFSSPFDPFYIEIVIILYSVFLLDFRCDAHKNMIMRNWLFCIIRSREIWQETLKTCYWVSTKQIFWGNIRSFIVDLTQKAMREIIISAIIRPAVAALLQRHDVPNTIYRYKPPWLFDCSIV